MNTPSWARGVLILFCVAMAVTLLAGGSCSIKGKNDTTQPPLNAGNRLTNGEVPEAVPGTEVTITMLDGSSEEVGKAYVATDHSFSTELDVSSGSILITAQGDHGAWTAVVADLANADTSSIVVNDSSTVRATAIQARMEDGLDAEEAAAAVDAR